MKSPMNGAERLVRNCREQPHLWGFLLKKLARSFTGGHDFYSISRAAIFKSQRDFFQNAQLAGTRQRIGGDFLVLRRERSFGDDFHLPFFFKIFDERGRFGRRVGRQSQRKGERWMRPCESHARSGRTRGSFFGLPIPLRESANRQGGEKVRLTVRSS